jgi:hypothetical protein
MMTIAPELAPAAVEYDYLDTDSFDLVTPKTMIQHWGSSALAEEAQNPSWYNHKSEVLWAIAEHPNGSDELVQMALASNEHLPSDLIEHLIRVTPSTRVLHTLIATQVLDDPMTQRARHAIESISALRN